MIFAQVIYPNQTYRDYYAGQLYAGTPMAIIGAGNSVTFSFNFLEQVANGVSFADFTATAGTLTTEWRTSTNGSTWTAWSPLTTVTVAAFTATANNKLYIEVRYSVTGAPATIYGLNFRLNLNPNATSGRGTIEDTNIINDLAELFKGVLESERVEDTAGRPIASVKYTDPILSTAENSSVIYYTGFRILPATREYCTTDTYRISFTVGVKQLATEARSKIDRQAARYLTCFGARWKKGEYDLTYKGDSYVGVTLGYFGLQDFTSQTVNSFADPRTNSYYHELSISFTLKFINFDNFTP